jgi:hypothetical protein
MEQIREAETKEKVLNKEKPFNILNLKNVFLDNN